MLCVNVGGVCFVTRASTLQKSSSFFSNLLKSHPDASELFVDRDPAYFRYVLNWMRGVRCLPEDDTILQELLWESDYYCVHDMRDHIQRMKNRFSHHRLLQNIAIELKHIVQSQQTLSHSLVQTLQQTSAKASDEHPSSPFPSVPPSSHS